MTYFRIADLFIEIIKSNDFNLPCFVFGNIAPDCGMPNDDGCTYTPDKPFLILAIMIIGTIIGFFGII